MKSTYRAWSGNWAKSLTFSEDLINSEKWLSFKKYCRKQLGKDWGWELACETKIDKDEKHFSLDSFTL